MNIDIPYNFDPRWYQTNMFNMIANGFRRGLFVWHRRCMSGDSHVIMADGSWKYLRDMRRGEAIMSWNGATCVPDVVKDVWETGRKECIEHHTTSKDTMVCTKDHRVYAVDEEGNGEWIMAGEMRPEQGLLHYEDGRALVCRREKVESHTFDLETEECGCFIADGYVVHNSGKDKTLINLTIKEAVKTVGSYYYFFPTYNQGRKVIWDGMDRDGFKFLNHIPNAMIDGIPNQTEMKVKFKNGSIFQIIGTDNMDGVIGTNPIGCVFSESALQDPEAWQLVSPILRENGGWAIHNSTPRGHNHFFELYNMALTNPEWFCELLTVNDTGVITEEDIQKERDSGMSEALIEQEYFCSFSSTQSGQLIPFSVVQTARERKYAYEAYRHAPIVIGVDVARFGDDSSVICVRQGVKVLEFRQFRGLDTRQVTAQVCMAQDEYKRGLQATFVDGVGIGAGVVDQLRGLGRSVWDVQSAASPNKRGKYLNKRAEMWDNMKEALRSVLQIPDDKELVNDLTNPRFEYTRSNALKLESKEDMKKRKVPSPNKGDALAYTYYMPVADDIDEIYEDEFEDSDYAVTGSGVGASKWTGY